MASRRRLSPTVEDVQNESTSILPNSDRGSSIRTGGSGTPADAYPDLAALQAAHQAKGIIMPNKTYRMMEWECHTPPEGNFKIDLDAALRAARDAGAESMMFYSQDHWGHAFYPSEAAVRHPHLEGDFFGREVSIARKLGMSIVCYYSLQFNNQAVLSHPDWGWVNEAGEQQKMRWLITCLDTPYRQYVLNMMNELFSRYEIDELFLDIFGIQFHAYHSSDRDPFCFCKHTEQAWDKEHPGDPYRAGFANREGWDRRYQWHQKRTMDDMLDEIIATARKHVQPDRVAQRRAGSFSGCRHAESQFHLRRAFDLCDGDLAGIHPDARLGPSRLPGRRVQPARLPGHVRGRAAAGQSRRADPAERARVHRRQRPGDRRAR